jgi:hypothetical protein
MRRNARRIVIKTFAASLVVTAVFLALPVVT